MAKTKIEKIAGIEEEIRQLENKRRQLVQAQKRRSARTGRNAFASAWGCLKACCPKASP